MRYSTILMIASLVILLTIAAGCTSAPANGPLTSATETTIQPAPVVTTASPASTPVITVTTGTKCQSGQTSCADGTCRDTTSDHDACGGCGNVCPAGYICKASNCVNPAGTAAPAAVVTQVITSQTTAVPVNPATTTVPTTTPAPQGASRYSGSAIGSNFQQGIVISETTYPPDTKIIDCSKYPISITSISPASGPKSGGTTVVIRGSGFKRGSYLLVNTLFGATAAPAPANGATSDTEIVVKTPPVTSAGTVNVQVSAVLSWVSNRCQSPVSPAAKFTYT